MGKVRRRFYIGCLSCLYNFDNEFYHCTKVQLKTQPKSPATKFGMRISTGLLASFLFMISIVPQLQAKLIEPEGLILQIIDSYKLVSQYTMETTVRIYDPETFAPLSEKIENHLESGEQHNKEIT